MRVLIALLAVAAVGAVGWSLRLSRRLRHSERDRRRLELVRSSGGEPTRLVADVQADSAAAVPLRAHGVVVGTLVIANPRGGGFAAEDIRLLSTVATHAAIVIANARFFEMVRHAKEQWETAFDSLSEGIAVVDDAGRVRRANRSLAAMLGAPIPGVIGRELVEALVGTSPPLVDVLAAARAGDRVQPIVLRSTTLGRAIRVTAARIPAPGAGGAQDQSVVVLVEDVTDQQAMESHLIQSEKLAAVGQLVSGVAHELNNPLTSIAGLSEFLLEQKELGAKDRGHLRVIHEQADRAGRIVRNLLTFARKGPAEQAPVDLNDVIQRTLLLMSFDLTLKDIVVETELGTVPPVLGDRHALQQVLLNLLNNAAQAVAENPPERPRVIRLLTWFDDPAVRRMVKALFGREGHTVDVARNVQHALDLVGARAYDLILADAQARARDQLFVTRLVEAHPALKHRVLVATGDVRPGSDDALIRLGLRYVRKPFNLRDLRDEAARMWAAGALS